MPDRRVDSIFYLPPEPHFGEPPRGEESEEPKEKSQFGRLLRNTIGAIVVLGLIYFSGIHQALFYQRTSTDVPQEKTESILDAETVVLPVKVFVFTNDEKFGSERTEQDVRQMVAKASEIWNQADIDLELVDVVYLEATDSEIGSFLIDPSSFVLDVKGYDYGVVNAFLSRTLKGIEGVNGIAFPGIRTMAVADLTTVYDFRVFAHEVGHVLGLKHTEESRDRLMYRSVNGFDLTSDEVLRAREFASGLSVQ